MGGSLDENWRVSKKWGGELIAPSQPVIRHAMSTVPTSIPEEWCHLFFHHPTDSLLPPGMEDSASEGEKKP